MNGAYESGEIRNAHLIEQAEAQLAANEEEIVRLRELVMYNEGVLNGMRAALTAVNSARATLTAPLPDFELPPPKPQGTFGLCK